MPTKNEKKTNEFLKFLEELFKLRAERAQEEYEMISERTKGD